MFGNVRVSGDFKLGEEEMAPFKCEMVLCGRGCIRGRGGVVGTMRRT